MNKKGIAERKTLLTKLQNTGFLKLDLKDHSNLTGS